jgi:hypothetical protein
MRALGRPRRPLFQLPDADLVGSSRWFDTYGQRGYGTRSAASCQACARDTSGRIARSTSARRAFRSYNPCPATGATRGPCAGYVIDHIQALKHGGADSTRQHAMANSGGGESEGSAGVGQEHRRSSGCSRIVKLCTKHPQEKSFRANALVVPQPVRARSAP